MYRREIFRSLGVCSTVLFVSSAAFLLVLGLRHAGIKWWVIFSLSGHSAVLLFMAASLYAFAVFRSILGSQKIRREHPLTSLSNYMTFYNMSPLLGGFVGAILGLGRTDLLERGISLAFGCLSTTFFVWVVLDPFLGFVEMLLPSCRRYRSERLSAEKAEAQRRKTENRRMLYDLEEHELEQEQLRRAKLVPISEDLTGLLANYRLGLTGIESQVVDKGVEAWQMGGIVCMRQLHKLTTEMLIERFGEHDMVDHISIWWDGIGKWRKPLITTN